MPPSKFIYNGVGYDFPKYTPNGTDNVIANGQTITIPKAKYFAAQMLATAESGMISQELNSTYEGGSQSSSAVLVPAFQSWPYPAGGDLVFPFFYTNTSVNY